MDTLQISLIAAAFSTYGLGDGITAAALMKKKGTSAESNVIGKYAYDKFGAAGLIAIKAVIIAAIAALAMVTTDMYWTINGILVGVTICGVMATDANIKATNDKPFTAPAALMQTFIYIIIALAGVGIVIDLL